MGQADTFRPKPNPDTMKRLFAALSFVGAVAFSANAQFFEDGGNYLHIGAGIGSPYAYSGSKMGVPPVHVSFEHGLSDKFGVGGLIGYTSSVYEETFWGNSTYKWNFSYLIIGARGAYHFLDKDNIDLYLGAMLGYNVATAKFESDYPGLENLVTEPSVGGIAFGGFLGTRFALGDNSAIFAELGYNISWLSLGYCHKF